LVHKATPLLYEANISWDKFSLDTLESIRTNATLGDLSTVLGEVLTDYVAHGATEFHIKIDAKEISIAANVSDLQLSWGYNSNIKFLEALRLGKRHAEDEGKI